MHTALENWYRHGTPPPNTPTGRAARASLKHLPARGGAGLRVELAWQLQPYANLTYTGAIDLCDVTVRHEYSLTQPHRPELARSYVQMWDHKSCADVKWAKTPAALEEDISACAYAHYLCITYDVDEVRCRWVYTQRDAKASVPVDFVITREQAARRWEQTLGMVDRMQETLRTPPQDPLVLPPTLSACDAYGGCPFRERCHPEAGVGFSLAPPKQRATLPLVAIEVDPAANKLVDDLLKKARTTGGNKPMSKLLEKIRAQKAGVAPAAPVADPINPPDAAPHNTPTPAALPQGDAALAGYTDKELLQELLRRAL